MNDAQVFIFGDSITWGGWDTEGGWVARLRKYVDARVVESNFEYYREIYNLGISANNTEKLLQRFDDETRARREVEEEELVILFAIGTNDSQFNNVKGKHRVEVGQFKKNLYTLVQMARQYTDKIAFVGLFPVDENRTDPIPWGPEKSYKIEYLREYDAVIQSVCEDEEIPFIPLFEAFETKEFSKLLVDGLHPNNEGHKLIAGIVQEMLEAWGWI